MPVGVLIYRLDRLLYANHAFLERIGYDSLRALEEAGGVDALYVEPGVSNASSTSNTGTPVTISAGQQSSEHAPKAATAAHLHTISWDGDSALALICAGAPAESAAIAATIAPAALADQPSPVGHANAEELGAILDTTAEGIVMFDAEGNLNSCNRSAEALFGYDGDELVQQQSCRPVRAGKPAPGAGLSGEHAGRRRRQPARPWPRSARRGCAAAASSRCR